MTLQQDNSADPTESIATTPATAGDAASATTSAAGPEPTGVAAPVAVTPADVSTTPQAQTVPSPESFGRVADDGTVYVREGGDERVVGQYPDASAQEAMAFYVQRYQDLVTEVDLAEARLPQLGAKDVDSTIASLREQLQEPAAVGDLAGLRARVEQLAKAGEARKQEAAAEREAAKAEALSTREKIVEQVEKIAATDPQRIQWKQSGQRIHQLLEEWKDAQRRGPRLDRNTEDGLWKRFSKARTTFDRNRRQFFAELDARQKAAKAAKEDLISRAEAMNQSTDWGRTTIAYRQLMDEWKAAGRTNRREDDALWERFRAAQQVFFDARQSANDRSNAEQNENLARKRTLCEQAESLLPVTDPQAARAALRPIQEQWETIGFVPRQALSEVEGRMRAVEDAIRAVEDEQWRRTDPEINARRNALTSQIEDSLAELKVAIAEAEKSGDTAKLAKLQEEKQTKEAWLKQIS